MKFLKTLTVQHFMGANVATILLLWLSCGVTYLNPSTFPLLSLVALLFPVFALMNALFIVFWLIFKVRQVWLPLLGFLACYSFLRDYCPINPSFLHPADTTQRALRILSYNTKGYGGKAATDAEGRNVVVEFICNSGADLICLQESGGGGARLRDVNQRMKDLGYQCYNHKGQVLYSKLPILKTDTLSYPTRSNNGFKALLLDGQDTILLINNHFESNHLSDLVKDGYRDAIENQSWNAYGAESRDTIRKELRPMIKLLAKAVPFRAAQVDTVRNIVQQWLPRPVILCGDFNDPPVSCTLQQLTRNLQSAFRESGNGLGFTFHDRGFPVRIDHILFTPDRWQSCQTHVHDTISASDHFPITTILVRK